ILPPQLRRKVRDLWSLFWSSGLSNPLVAIEQITYLLFIRQLEALDRERVAQGKRSIYELTAEEKTKNQRQVDSAREHFPPDIPEEQKAELLKLVTNYEKCRWSYIRQNVSFPLLNDIVFPWLRSLEDRVGSAQNGDSSLRRISGRLGDAYFILDVNK